MEKLTVYLCGKVTGLDKEVYSKQFELKETVLKQLDFKVVNPVKLIESAILKRGYVPEWEDCMRICITKLMKCDAICLVNDISTSIGANIELKLSKDLGISEIEVNIEVNIKQEQ